MEERKPIAWAAGNYTGDGEHYYAEIVEIYEGNNLRFIADDYVHCLIFGSREAAQAMCNELNEIHKRDGVFDYHYENINKD